MKDLKKEKEREALWGAINSWYDTVSYKDTDINEVMNAGEKIDIEVDRLLDQECKRTLEEVKEKNREIYGNGTQILEIEIDNMLSNLLSKENE